MILFSQMKQQASVRRTYKKEMVVARSTLVHLRHSARAQPRPVISYCCSEEPAARSTNTYRWGEAQGTQNGFGVVATAFLFLLVLLPIAQGAGPQVALAMDDSPDWQVNYLESTTDTSGSDAAKAESGQPAAAGPCRIRQLPSHPAYEGTHPPHLSSAASTPSSSFFRGLSDAAPAPEPGEEVQQVIPTHSISQTYLWNELSSSAPNEGGQPQGEGATSQPAGVREPEAPTIANLKIKIKNVIRGHRQVRSDVMKRLFEDLRLERASTQKLIKIDRVLDDISANRERLLNERQSLVYELAVRVG